MKLAFQWYGFGHGQWCYFLLVDMWFVSILHSYTWDFSEYSCLFPLFSGIMKLQGQRVYVFYTLIDADKLFPKWLCHHVLLLILLWVPFSPDLHHHQILPIKNILPVWWTTEILFFCHLHFPLWIFCSYPSPIFLPGCLSFFFFSNEYERSLCIFRIEKGRGSGIRLQVSELCLCHLSTVTLSELSDFLAPPFPHLLHEVNNNNKLVIIVRVQWDGPCEAFSWGLDTRVSAPCQPLLLFDFIGWTYCGWASGVRVKHIWWMYTYLNWSTKSA